jgi:peptidoglycan/xylan/chitin deacetylase (PgdA/CDA1 family)
VWGCAAMGKGLKMQTWVLLAVLVLTAILVLRAPFMKYAFGVNRAITQEKVIALTYDDGPLPPYTLDLLDTLDRYQAKATFFEVGQRIQEHPEVTQAVIDRGHELANHSFSHPSMIFKAPNFTRSEIETTDQLLTSLGFTGTIHFRPPWGRRLLVVPVQMWQMGKKLIMWDVDSKDYRQDYTPEAIAQQVIDRIRPGSIVVMHDGGGDRSRSVAATDLILKTLSQQGYRFQTVSDLMQAGRVQ